MTQHSRCHPQAVQDMGRHEATRDTSPLTDDGVVHRNWGSRQGCKGSKGGGSEGSGESPWQQALVTTTANCRGVARPRRFGGKSPFLSQIHVSSLREQHIPEGCGPHRNCPSRSATSSRTSVIKSVRCDGRMSCALVGCVRADALSDPCTRLV
jgi:hypothetical protein